MEVGCAVDVVVGLKGERVVAEAEAVGGGPYREILYVGSRGILHVGSFPVGSFPPPPGRLQKWKYLSSTSPEDARASAKRISSAMPQSWSAMWWVSSTARGAVGDSCQRSEGGGTAVRGEVWQGEVW